MRVDRLSREQRSTLMASIRGKDTSTELAVRRLLHGMGFRYRLHVHGLPGKPDVAFIRKRKVIFVHGCFWHGHDCPAGRNIPKSNARYWHPKLARNKSRDAQNQRDLKRLGWDAMVVWECELKDLNVLAARLENFLIDESHEYTHKTGG